MFESLAPGRIYEGLVRKIMDFGAFVGWMAVWTASCTSANSAGDGSSIPATWFRKGSESACGSIGSMRRRAGIGLSYRDLLESPWDTADRKYLPNTPYHGRVMKIMEFGAFVELEPGVEGLVHISELSHKRVARVSDVVKEGEEIDVMVLSVDMDAKRISLSMKAVQPLPEPEMKAEAAPAAKPAEPPLPPPKPKKPAGPLKGGLGRSPEAERFGLKW